MLIRLILCGFLAAAGTVASAKPSVACGADAIGVSRTISVDTGGGLKVGSIQYRGRLPLRDMEVVLTFDDGPFPGRTDKVLDALRDACTKATFFAVGRMAKAYPEVLLREAAEGHTIGTHSYTHPESIGALPYAEGAREIDKGIAAVGKALGRPPAPFFRFPGLGQSGALRRKLAEAGLGIFSADVFGYDWTGISGEQVRRRSLNGLKAHRGGILLLHDTKQATGRMLPQLLKDLKAAGFSIVHVVPGRQLAPVDPTM